MVEVGRKKASLGNPGPPRVWNQKRNTHFGGLAILVTGVTVDPLALRPRLSPGLLLSVFFLPGRIIAPVLMNCLNKFVICLEAGRMNFSRAGISLFRFFIQKPQKDPGQFCVE